MKKPKKPRKPNEPRRPLTAEDLFPILRTATSPKALAANDNNQPLIRAAAYGRHSAPSVNGANSGSSAYQLEVCRAYAKTVGAEVVEVYSDENQTGIGLANRRGFQRLMRDAERGLFQMVLLTDMSRLGRYAATLVQYIERLDRLGIPVVIVGHGRLTKQTAMSMAVAAETSIAYLKTATRMAKQMRAKLGRYLTAPPYGYRKDRDAPGGIVVVEEEAAEIRRIVDAVLAGHTARAICRDLNKRGVRRPRGGIWTRKALIGTIRQPGVCRNPLIGGYTVYGRLASHLDPATGKRVDTPIPPESWIVAAVPHLAIVDEDRFRELQALLDRRSPGPVQPRGRRTLLGGRLRCIACGTRLETTGISANKDGYVRCSVAYNGGACNSHGTIRRGPVERAVLDHVQKLVASGSLESEAAAEYLRQRKLRLGVHVDDLKQARGEAAEIQRQIDKLLDAVVEDRVPRAWSQARMSELDERRLAAAGKVEHLERVLADLDDEITPIDRVREGIGHLKRFFERAGDGETMPEDAAEAIGRMFDSVTVLVEDRCYHIRATGFGAFETTVPRVRPGRPRKAA